MKLLDIIFEDPRIDRNTPEVLKQKLIDNPKTTGLSFNNVEIERNGKIIKIKNYTCKTHPTWIRDNWADMYEVRKGKLGCPICTVERNKKVYSEKDLKQELIDSPFTTNLTFNNVQFIGIDGRKQDIKIKNYSCKIHPTWFKDVDTSFWSVKDGSTGCRICSVNNVSKRAKEFHTKSDEGWLKDLNTNTITTGLSFNNVEFRRIEDFKENSRTEIKNYTCKIHPNWKQNEWKRIDTVLGGTSGCRICGVNSHIIADDKLKTSLIDNPNTTGLTFDNVEFQRDKVEKEEGDYIRIKVKNYSCKTHPKWFQDRWVQYGFVKNGKTGCDICAIESYDRLRGILSDRWDGKLTDNKWYNQWITKRNKILQNDWLKKSKEKHTHKKYNYSMVNFNDSETIVNVYNPDTKEYERKPKSGRQLLIGCPITNHGFFIQDSNNHKRGAGCPICRESRGEIYLANLFTSNDIKYLRGKDTRFEKLIGKKYGLISDFYLPKRKVFVEYDGEQHFRPSFGSTESSRMNKYTMTYENDNARNNFAKTNSEGISLIRIPYTMEFADIDKVLMRTIRYIKPNTVVELGDYPKRMKPKKILSKNQVDLNKPIIKPRRTNESKLSLIDTIKNINTI